MNFSLSRRTFSFKKSRKNKQHVGEMCCIFALVQRTGSRQPSDFKYSEEAKVLVSNSNSNPLRFVVMSLYLGAVCEVKRKRGDDVVVGRKIKKLPILSNIVLKKTGPIQMTTIDWFAEDYSQMSTAGHTEFTVGLMFHFSRRRCIGSRTRIKIHQQR